MITITITIQQNPDGIQVERRISRGDEDTVTDIERAIAEVYKKAVVNAGTKLDQFITDNAEIPDALRSLLSTQGQRGT